MEGDQVKDKNTAVKFDRQQIVIILGQICFLSKIFVALGWLAR